MTFIDERGRIFGRINLIDATLLFVFVGLVPLAYGGYLLFRTPLPRLTSIEPHTLVMDQRPTMDPQRVTIHGENLRPYMRVSFNDFQGRSFLFQDPTTAVIEIGDIAPGTFDVVLYDYAQERSRLPKAFTVTASALPSTSILVVGRVANLTEASAQRVVAGLKQTQFGPVLRVGRPTSELTRVHSGVSTVDIPTAGGYQVPVMIQVPCAVQMNGGQPTCMLNGAPLGPDVFLQLDTKIGPYQMQVDQVLGSEPIVGVDAVIHFAGNPDVLALIRPDDVDIGLSRNELTAGARVTAVSPSAGGREVTLQLQAQKSVDGWWYQGAPLRSGGTFVLRTKTYELPGIVLRVTPPNGA